MTSVQCHYRATLGRRSTLAVTDRGGRPEFTYWQAPGEI
jgi:hypothetical protein